jgi:acyl-coenzyme A synthetase/AMP-(fatty) acid ligase
MSARGIHGVAQADPGRVALIANERRISFGRLDGWANSIADRLSAVGVGHGSRVAVMLHNIPELFGVWNGAARLGVSWYPSATARRERKLLIS